MEGAHGLPPENMKPNGRVKKMEKKLRSLFDYQKFENNADLRGVIDDVHSRYPQYGGLRELKLEDMEQIAAAGVPYQKRNKDDESV